MFEVCESDIDDDFLYWGSLLLIFGCAPFGWAQYGQHFTMKSRRCQSHRTLGQVDEYHTASAEVEVSTALAAVSSVGLAVASVKLAE